MGRASCGDRCKVRSSNKHCAMSVKVLEAAIQAARHTVAVIFEQQWPVAGINRRSSSLRLDGIVGRGSGFDERHFFSFKEVVVGTMVDSSKMQSRWRIEYFLSALKPEGTSLLRRKHAKPGPSPPTVQPWPIENGTTSTSARFEITVFYNVRLSAVQAPT